MDRLVRFATVCPYLDHLCALQRRTHRIAHGPDQEAGGGLSAHFCKLSAHRHALVIGPLQQVGIGEHCGFIIHAGKEAHLHARAGRTEGFLAIHGIENGLARVGFRPYAGQSTGTELGRRYLSPCLRVVSAFPCLAAIGRNRPAGFGAGAILGSLAPMEFLNQRRRCNMRVAGADETELVRIESFRLLQGEAALADEILVLFEIGPFVIR